MRKPNLIIGKKQIILASLTLVLGIAVYMNYVFAEVGNDIAADAEIQSAADTQVNYGDAAFVGADSSDPAEPASAGASDYFAQARLSRMTSRDDAVPSCCESQSPQLWMPQPATMRTSAPSPTKKSL